MVKQIFSIFFIILCIFACSKNNKQTETHIEQQQSEDELIYINLEDILQKEGSELLSSAASEIHYIPLETNKQSVIRSISKVVIWEEKLLIGELFNLKLFDRTGKYIRHISQTGSGPADFRHVNNILVNPSSNEFYIITQFKAIKFDSQASFIKNIRLENVSDYVPAIYNTGIFTPDGTFLFYMINSDWVVGDTTTVYSLIKVDTLGTTLAYYENQFPRYYESIKMPYRLSFRPLYVYDNHVRFIEFGHDTLYTIQHEQMIPYAVVDLGKMKTNHTPELPQISMIDPREIEDALANKPGLSLVNLYENNSFLFITLAKGFMSDIRYNTVYNKQTGELNLLKEEGLTNDLDGGIAFYPRKIEANGDMIMWKSAEVFKEEILSKDYDAQKAKYGERFEKVYRLAESLQDDDNPIIIVAKGKK